ncbi:hypothetical protein GCM10023142_24070 [Anaerocolumna aminovalerica]
MIKMNVYCDLYAYCMHINNFYNIWPVKQLIYKYNLKFNSVQIDIGFENDLLKKDKTLIS